MSEAAVASIQSGIYLFSEFIPDAVAAFSTREFEASKDIPRFLENLGISPPRFSTVQQVHGDRVILAAAPVGMKEDSAPEADGLVTGEKNLPLVIRTADCVPLFFFDSETPAVGMSHAGWRGAKERIVFQTVEKFREHFDSSPASLRVAIGPAIRESCYEVGPEFQDYFPGFVRKAGDKYFCNLVGVVKNQLREAGLEEESIVDSNLCTACAVEKFFSARREGVETGRLISTILLK